MPGPCFLDLRQAVTGSTEAVGWIFPVGGIGCLVGSVISGLFFNVSKPHKLIISFLIVCSAGYYLTPWCRHLWQLLSSVFTYTMATGFLDAAVTTWLLSIWGPIASGPYVQGIHFAVGLMSIASPLIAEPFLTRLPDGFNETQIDRFVEENGPRNLRIQWCYGIVGTTLLSLAIVTLANFLFSKSAHRSDLTRDRHEVSFADHMTLKCHVTKKCCHVTNESCHESWPNLT